MMENSNDQMMKTSSLGTKILHTFIMILILGFLTVLFDKSLNLSSYVDYFEPIKMSSLAGNYTATTASATKYISSNNQSDGSSVESVLNISSTSYKKVVKANDDIPKETESIIIWNNEVYQQIRDKSLIVSPSTKIQIEEEFGSILYDEEGKPQIVVNLNETYMFWNNGQGKLCQLLRNVTLSSRIDGTDPVPSALLNFTMDCIDHAKNKQGLGQGNWVTGLYAARMASALSGVDSKFQCTDGQDSKMNLLLPWFDKYQVAPSDRNVWPYSGPRPSENDACKDRYRSLRIDRMASQIQDDLRRMAVKLVGTRDAKRKHIDVPTDQPPLIPDVELDDVALHFRCGDVLGGAKRNDFGMIRFYEYKKWIPRDTESIAILTQPFEKERNRGQDARKADNCKKVVEALVFYLQAFAPKSRITIRNDMNETLVSILPVYGRVVFLSKRYQINLSNCPLVVSH